MTYPMAPVEKPLEKPYAEGRWQPQKMVWWYWAIIDEMVANPDVTKKELADRFNVSYACIQLVTTSDVFQYHFIERKRERALAIDSAIQQRLVTVATKSLEHLATALDKKRDAIPIRDLTSLANTALERLGYGVKEQAPGVTVNNNVVVPVALADLEQARAALRAVEGAKLIEASRSESADLSADLSPALPQED